MNKWSKLALVLEILVIILLVLTLSDFEFMNTDPDEAFMMVGFISLILSLVFSITGAYKTNYTETNSFSKKISILIVISVPLLAIIGVISLIKLFGYGP